MHGFMANENELYVQYVIQMYAFHVYMGQAVVQH